VSIINFLKTSAHRFFWFFDVEMTPKLVEDNLHTSVLACLMTRRSVVPMIQYAQWKRCQLYKCVGLFHFPAVSGIVLAHLSNLCLELHKKDPYPILMTRATIRDTYISVTVQSMLLLGP
jgi:hypothetical protein